MNVITKKIEKHFNELGIKKNDNIIIHSNIITFGIFNKNLSKLIIDIIIDRIGRDGSLAMPLYNLGFESKKIINLNKHFKKNRNSIMSKTFFKKYNVCRSKSILHSHLVIGKLKNQFDRRKVFKSFGENSDFDFFLKKKFKLILLGCTPKEGCTYIHNLEYVLNLPYRKKKLISFKLKLNNKYLNKKILYPIRKENINVNLNKFFFNNKIFKFVKTSNLKFGKSYIIKLDDLDYHGRKLLKNNPYIMTK